MVFHGMKESKRGGVDRRGNARNKKVEDSDKGCWLEKG